MYQDRAVRIKDTDTHRPGMQVDAAVKSVLLQVESHHGPPSKKGRWVSGNNQHTCLRRGHDEYHSVQLSTSTPRWSDCFKNQAGSHGGLLGKKGRGIPVSQKAAQRGGIFV